MYNLFVFYFFTNGFLSLVLLSAGGPILAAPLVLLLVYESRAHSHLLKQKKISIEQTFKTALLLRLLLIVVSFILCFFIFIDVFALFLFPIESGDKIGVVIGVIFTLITFFLIAYSAYLNVKSKHKKSLFWILLGYVFSALTLLMSYLLLFGQ